MGTQYDLKIVLLTLTLYLKLEKNLHSSAKNSTYLPHVWFIDLLIIDLFSLFYFRVLGNRNNSKVNNNKEFLRIFSLSFSIVDIYSDKEIVYIHTRLSHLATVPCLLSINYSLILGQIMYKFTYHLFGFQYYIQLTLSWRRSMLYRKQFHVI